MENEANAIKVKIGVYSGRENPEMTLEGDVQKQFAEMALAGLGKEAVQPPGRAKLGRCYGFLVHVPPEVADALSLPQRVEIRDGVVSVPAREKTQYWRDISGLEDFLIRLAFAQGHGELLSLVDIKPRDEEKARGREPSERE